MQYSKIFRFVKVETTSKQLKNMCIFFILFGVVLVVLFISSLGRSEEEIDEEEHPFHTEMRNDVFLLLSDLEEERKKETRE